MASHTNIFTVFRIPSESILKMVKRYVSSIHFSKIDVVLDSVSLAFRRISRNGCIVYHFDPLVRKGENEKN